MKRFGFAAIAVFMVIATLTLANPTQVHAGGCANEYVSGNFNLATGCSVSGDVSMNGQVLYDNDPLTGLVVTCGLTNGCSGYANWGASVSGESSDGLAARMRSNGCGTGYGCPRGVSQVYWSGQQPAYQPPVYTPPVTYTRTYFSPGTPVIGGWIYINGSYVGYSCYVPSAWGYGYADGGSVNPQFSPGAQVTLCSGGTTVPVPAYVPPMVVYPPVYPSGTQTGWGNASITIGASGTYSWIVINGLGQTFTNCWFPSTPPGGGSASNAVPNLATVTNPPPTSLPLCGPFSTSNGLMEIRTMDWYPGMWVKAQGIAIATNDGRSCNSGNCTADQATMASTGGRIWFLALAGSPQGSVSPFTAFNTVGQPPTIVFPGTTETPIR